MLYAVEALKCIEVGTPIYENLISDCRSLLNRLAVWELCHTFREQNQTTNLMAKEGAQHDRFGDRILGAKYDLFGDTTIFIVSSLFVQEKLCIDNSEISFSRKHTTNSISYSNSNVALGQHFDVNHIDKHYRLVQSRNQLSRP